MDVSEFLASLAETPGSWGEADAKRALTQLNEGLRCRRRDRIEVLRIGDIIDVVEAEEDAYQRCLAAIKAGNLDVAERHLWHAAEHNHEEAPYWLSLLHLLRHTDISANATADIRQAIGIELRPYELLTVYTDEHGTPKERIKSSLDDMEAENVVRNVAAVVERLIGDQTHASLVLQLGGTVDPESGVVLFFHKVPTNGKEFK